MTVRVSKVISFKLIIIFFLQRSLFLQGLNQQQGLRHTLPDTDLRSLGVLKYVLKGML
ncbi:hypothetical protein GECvBN5_gp169 [Salmonella phage GEC_vB_N5]|uniref:Uncharacterized protein n=1 Tax=Salmonella phage GEC_vB_N5 TaxID=2777378 RepID=A0A7S9SPI8_9CAUD|nr:hypothetical protein GECvBN5_gp169 [Salmonella phage GEC_vB_N5]